MQKNSTVYDHIFKIMRITGVQVVVAIMFSGMAIAHDNHAQDVLNREVSLSLKDVTLEQALAEIGSNAKVKFGFSPNKLKLDEKVTVEVSDKKLGEVLEELLAPRSITYTVKEGEDYIILTEKDDKASTVSTNELAAEKQFFVTITGAIADNNGTSLAGVNVLEKGTTNGTASDSQGKYTLSVGDNATLVFSFIGFKTVEEQVNARTTIDITMEEDATTLQSVEVRSTGYWTDTKERSTGNIAKITSKDIENQPVTSPLMSLQGRMAGVDVTPYSGVPGSAVKIEIRGQNSLRGEGSYPLYVIDGVPVDSRPVDSGNSSLLDNGFDPLSNINPASIESIEVLKDGQATSIYGSRGANGVIIVKTKQGSKTGGTNFDFSFYSGVGKIAHKADLLNTKEYVPMRKEAYKNDGVPISGFAAIDLLVWDTTRYTDWQKELLGGSANIIDGQVGISGGNENTTFRLGLGGHKENTIYSGDFGYSSFSGNFNLSHSTADKRFLIVLSLNYGFNKNKLFDDSNFVPAVLTTPPNAPELYTENGELNWEPYPGVGIGTFGNPLAYLQRTHDSNSGTLFINNTLSYEIIPGLIAKANLGFSELNNKEHIIDPIKANDPFFIDEFTTGNAIFGSNVRRSWIIEPQLLYSKEISGHNFSSIIGATLGEITSEYEQIHGLGYSSDVLLSSPLGASTQLYSTNSSQYRYNSIYLRLGYDWRGKYLIDLIGRRDGSSRFGPGNRFGNFGGFGAGWIFSKEGFMQSLSNVLSFGKIRGSYASTGNDQIGDYKFYNTYSISTYKYQGTTALYPDALFNPEYQWEVTKKLEFAVELKFLRDRISIEGSWYRNRSSNQLINYSLPTATGFGSILENFDATVENSGYELLLGTVNIKSDNFQWLTFANLTLPRNKLVEFPNIEESSYATIYKVGEPLSIQRLYTYVGVNPTTGLHEVLDANEDGTLDDADKKFMKPLGREYYGGITNTFIYKRFELSFLFQFSKQTAYGYLPPTMPGRPSTNQFVEVLDRWQIEGDVTDVAKFSRNSINNLYYADYVFQSDRNTITSSFIRLKTLSLSYSLPFKVLNRIKMKDAKVYLHGQNLFTHSDFIGLDPETGSGTLPPLRMITMGIQFKF